MYVKSTRPSAKREVQKERSAQRDDRIARPRRAQTCERSELRAMRMCPRILKNYIQNRKKTFSCSILTDDLKRDTNEIVSISIKSKPH